MAEHPLLYSGIRLQLAGSLQVVLVKYLGWCLTCRKHLITLALNLPFSHFYPVPKHSENIFWINACLSLRPHRWRGMPLPYSSPPSCGDRCHVEVGLVALVLAGFSSRWDDRIHGVSSRRTAEWEQNYCLFIHASFTENSIKLPDVSVWQPHLRDAQVALQSITTF